MKENCDVNRLLNQRVVLSRIIMLRNSVNTLLFQILTASLLICLISCNQQSCIETNGGNSNGTNCVFPFIYNGSSYDQCIDLDHTYAWCATSIDYDTDGLWGNCIVPAYNVSLGPNNGSAEEGYFCRFPFKIGEDSYTTCIVTEISEEPWCKMGDGEEWGYCDLQGKTCEGIRCFFLLL